MSAARQREQTVVAPAKAYKERSQPLAQWASAWVVNRTDCYGGYYEKDGVTYTTTRKVEKGAPRLTVNRLQRHFGAATMDHVVGVHAIVRDEAEGEGEVTACWSRWVAIDVDQHGEDRDSKANFDFARSVWEEARSLGFNPLLIDSNGKGGFHVWVIFDKPIPTEKAYAFVRWLKRDWKEFKVNPEPEAFPKQRSVTKEGKGSFGNWLRLPGRHPKRDKYSRVWDGDHWLEDTEAVNAIIATVGSSVDLIPAEAFELPICRNHAKRVRSAPLNFDDISLATDALRYINGEFLSDYDKWLGIGFALRGLDVVGLDLWDAWSRGGGDKYEPGACADKWPTMEAADANGVSLGSLFHWAAQAGWKDPRIQPRDDEERSPARTATQNRPPSRGQDVTIEALDEPPKNTTDLGNAERYVEQHGNDLRFCKAWKDWLVWDEQRWAIDDTGIADYKATQTARTIRDEAMKADSESLHKWADESERHSHLKAMVSIASTFRNIALRHTRLDRDLSLFNVLNGTLDLRTGELRPHRREDLITKLCPIAYEPDAKCPLWESTVNLFLAGDKGDKDLITYFQRLCGYAMVGVVRDHIMPIAYGKGANGKSTILGTLIEVFGPDYAMKAHRSMFMAKMNETHPTEQADLFGKRLVIAIETEAGRRLDEPLIKELTGGDKIRARRMRENFWEFPPTHTLFMATNHKPVIQGTDHGIWRRLKLIPFTVTVSDEKAIKDMPEKLRAEYPGILAWCVRGCLDWHEHGLPDPNVVKEATKEYRNEQDVLELFLTQCTIRASGPRVKAAKLYERYRRWAEKSGEKALTLTAFGNAITDKGIEKDKSNYVWYLDLGLLEEPSEEPEEKPEEKQKEAPKPEDDDVPF